MRPSGDSKATDAQVLMPVMRMDTVGIRPSAGIAPAGAMSPLLAKIAGQMRLWHSPWFGVDSGLRQTTIGWK
jgi:hypothetical protein